MSKPRSSGSKSDIGCFQKSEGRVLARTRVHRARLQQASRRRAAFSLDNRKKNYIPLPNMTCRITMARLAQVRDSGSSGQDFSNPAPKPLRSSEANHRIRETCSLTYPS